MRKKIYIYIYVYVHIYLSVCLCIYVSIYLYIPAYGKFRPLTQGLTIARKV